MNPEGAPRLVPLEHLDDGEEVGGKAAGLARLIRMGLRVPEGFVIVGAAPGRLPAGLEEACARLGGAVAVRSSALGEDGAEASFAGQYETILGVQGAQAVRDAVERCLASARGERAGAYRDGMRAGGDIKMAVVVQRMVDAMASGVLFTADPVTGKQDRVVVNAVTGLGEALVSGHRAADQFVLSREGGLLEREVRGASAAIGEYTLRRLLDDALQAEARLGHPLDMEWAVGGDGALYWLQARPITNLDLPGIDELDTPLEDPRTVLTTYNVNEVLPGAITPLSWSGIASCIDDAMHDLYLRGGVSRAAIEKQRMIMAFSGRLFLNLSTMYIFATQVFGASKENVDYSLAGRLLPEVELGQKAPFFKRLGSTVRYFRALLTARQRLDELTPRAASFRLGPAADAAGWFQRIEESLGLVRESLTVHLNTSALSGALYGVLLRVLSKGALPSAPHHAAAAALLADVKSTDADVSSSSLGLAEALNRVVATLAADPAVAARFSAMTPEEALAWLQEVAPEPVRKEYHGFLRDHGHRCIREAELRERDWLEDPRPLVASLQRAVGAPRAAPTRGREAEEAFSALSFLQRWLIRWLLPRAQDAVVLRERSKSLSIRLARTLKRGYVAMAELLVADGRLPDTDLLFFLTSEELRQLTRGPDRAIVRRALHRRRLYPQQMALEFPPISVGKPVPLGAEVEAGAGTVMHGTPVSRGVAVGAARVARTPEEASAMQPGEILVVPYTDVGWTPYFSRAAGLATEIGSPLSHGAVVAREYGLPAVVNLPGATRRFKTGDLLRLDGNTGELRRMT